MDTKITVINTTQEAVDAIDGMKRTLSGVLYFCSELERRNGLSAYNFAPGLCSAADHLLSLVAAALTLSEKEKR